MKFFTTHKFIFVTFDVYSYNYKMTYFSSVKWLSKNASRFHSTLNNNDRIWKWRSILYILAFGIMIWNLNIIISFQLDRIRWFFIEKYSNPFIIGTDDLTIKIVIWSVVSISKSIDILHSSDDVWNFNLIQLTLYGLVSYVFDKNQFNHMIKIDDNHQILWYVSRVIVNMTLGWTSQHVMLRCQIQVLSDSIVLFVDLNQSCKRSFSEL